MKPSDVEHKKAAARALDCYERGAPISDEDLNAAIIELANAIGFLTLLGPVYRLPRNQFVHTLSAFEQFKEHRKRG